MRIVPVYISNSFLRNGNNRHRSIARLREALSSGTFLEASLRQQQAQVSEFLERVLSSSRVLIVEGISGSGKDTFQNYLKENLQRRGRDVYDYSEGDVLHSWKQLQIAGVLQVRVHFMRLFANYMRDVINRDDNAVFLLNRFHLSTYASTIVEQPDLRKEYDEIINVLQTLPVHIFILLLNGNEIEKRSAHPERAGAWRKFQKQVAEGNSFRHRLERQQRLILQAVKRQQIAYSVIRLISELEDEPVVPRVSGVDRRSIRLNRAEIAGRKPTPILLKR